MNAPLKSECPLAGGHHANNKNSNNDLDFATGERPRKALSSALAILALHGYAVLKGSNGDYSVSRRGISQGCDDLEALQDFARQIGAQS
mgnify:CR=1 FL=1